MRVKINLDEVAPVLKLSEYLANIRSSQEPLEVELVNSGFCPNRVVPILAMLDVSRSSRAGQVTVSVSSEMGAQALFGFNSGNMRPGESVCRPFGRVWRFDNADDLNLIVNAVELELNKTVRLAKGVKLCFTWCLNEVMDNVLNHSAAVGNATGYTMVQYVPAEKLLKVCVFDMGIGLKASFEGSKYSPKTDEVAIRLAVQENVTSGKGQGNGLYGLKRLVGQSPMGKLHIKSGSGEYLYNPQKNVENARQCSPLVGISGSTMVDFQIVCDGELSFEQAFPGSQGQVDLWIEDHETESGAVRVKVLDIVGGCGSRENGREVRTVVENLVEADKRKVVIDFEGAETCSSAFVDELVGKLLEKYGFSSFAQVVSIANINGIVALLLNHSVQQRIAGECSNRGQELGATGESSSVLGNSENSVNIQRVQDDNYAGADALTDIGSDSQIEGVSKEVEQ